MALTMHAAEDLIAGIQDRRVDATPTVITQALACLDLVARWVDAFEVARRASAASRRRSARHVRTVCAAFCSRSRGWIGSVGRSELAGMGCRHDRRPPQRDQRISRIAPGRTLCRLATSRMPAASSTATIRSPAAARSPACSPCASKVRPRSDLFRARSVLPAICGSMRSRKARATGWRAMFRLVPDQVRIFDLPADALRPSPETGRRRVARDRPGGDPGAVRDAAGRRQGRQHARQDRRRRRAARPTRCVTRGCIRSPRRSRRRATARARIRMRRRCSRRSSAH